MHDSVLIWTKSVVETHALEGLSVLEIGSYDVNGSIRQIFKGPYVGVDLEAGPGVDVVVANAAALPFPEASFDVVASTEALEHDPTFWLTLAEVGRVLRPGGHLLLTARGNCFPYHGHKHYPDAYRFMADSIPALARLACCEVVAWEQDPQVPGVFLHGRRGGAP